MENSSYEKTLAGVIISHWPEQFCNQYGGVLPETYLTYDVETSGFSRENDLILEWGHCLVENRECVDRLSVILNWYAVDTVDHTWLDGQINRLSRTMQAEGRPWHLTPAILKEKGIAPAKALQFIYDLLATCQDARLLFVTHNGWNFDCQMLVSHFEQDLGKEFTFKPNSIFDTSLIEKASQLIDDPRALPLDRETMQAYFKRISNMRCPGIKHSLDRHCVPKYGLDKRAGVNTDALHSAGEDAYVLHLLFEQYRALAQIAVHRPMLRGSSLQSVVKQPPAVNTTSFRKQLNR